MLRQIVLFIFINMALFSQSVYTSYFDTIQWMDTIDHKIMAITTHDGVALYFSDGASFMIPLPKVTGTRLFYPQAALTEDGINLVAKRAKTTPTPDNNEPLSILQFYHISYNDIKNGKSEWRLTRPSISIPDFISIYDFNCQLVPLNENMFLACLPAPFMGGIPSVYSEEIHDWVIYGLSENNKLIEYGSGDWTESEGSYLKTGGQQGSRFFRDSKFAGLTFEGFNKIVHTKNYLTIVNFVTGRMLVFSKETGKLIKRIKLTDAVPPEQDKRGWGDEFVCLPPIIIVQPDMDDGIVVCARKDFDILESIDVFDKYYKLRSLEKPVEPIVRKVRKDEEGLTYSEKMILEALKTVVHKGEEELTYYTYPTINESTQFRNEFLSKSVGVEWYRADLENRNVKRIKPLDVPNEWDDTGNVRSQTMRPPYFIPFENGQILFGGIEKGFQELIGSVFIKPVEKTKPENPVKTEDKYSETTLK